MATRTLIECVQDLPLELYDKICEYTFVPPEMPQPILIDKSYKPPPMLQVNRASREVYTSIYVRCLYFAELSDLVLWLKARRKVWQAAKIRCWTDEDPNLSSGMMERSMCRTLMEHLDMYLVRRVRMYRNKEDALKGIEEI